MRVKNQQLDWDMNNGLAQSWERNTSKLYIVLSPCFFNFSVGYILRNVRLDESEAGIKISGRNINNYKISEISILNIKKQRHYFADKCPYS